MENQTPFNCAGMAASSASEFVRYVANSLMTCERIGSSRLADVPLLTIGRFVVAGAPGRQANAALRTKRASCSASGSGRLLPRSAVVSGTPSLRNCANFRSSSIDARVGVRGRNKRNANAVMTRSVKTTNASTPKRNGRVADCSRSVIGHRMLRCVSHSIKVKRR